MQTALPSKGNKIKKNANHIALLNLVAGARLELTTFGL